MNIYKPRKADLRLRSQEKATDGCYDNTPYNLDFGQNNNVNYIKNKNMGNNKLNKVTYIRKKNSIQDNNNFVKDNYYLYCYYNYYYIAWMNQNYYSQCLDINLSKFF